MYDVPEGISLYGKLKMSPRKDDYEDVKKASSKVQKGTYRNFTKEDLRKAGLIPLDVSGKLLKCVGEERNFCFYDNNLLSVEINGQIAILSRCHQCGTIYYSSASKTKGRFVLTEAIGQAIEPQTSSDLEKRTDEPRSGL